MIDDGAIEARGERDTRRFVRYLAVGVALFVLDFAVFVLLHVGLHVEVGVSQAISRTLGAAAGFVAHRKFTFPARERAHSLTGQGAGYVVLTIVNLLLAPLLIELLDWLLNGAGVIAKILTDVVMVLETYLVLKFLFRQRRSRNV